jgi:hypothetical protein
MMAVGMVALMGAFLLLDKHLPALLRGDRRRWRLPSLFPRMRTDP